MSTRRDSVARRWASSTFVGLICLCCLLPATTMVRLVEGWGYAAPDFPTPSDWSSLFPGCANSATTLQSPIGLSSFAESLGVPQLINTNVSSTESYPFGTTPSSSEFWAMEGVESASEQLGVRASTAIRGLFTAEVLDSPFRLSRRALNQSSSNPLSAVSSLTSTDTTTAAADATDGLESSLSLSEVFVHYGAEHSDVAGSSSSSSVTNVKPVAEAQLLFRSFEGVARLLVCIPLFDAATATSTGGTGAAASTSPIVESLLLTGIIAGASASTASDRVLDVSLTVSQLLQSIFPSDGIRARFVSYNGSVTVPPCTANVTVLVSQHHRIISAEALSRLVTATTTTTAASGETTTVSPLTRPLQSLVGGTTSTYSIGTVELINGQHLNGTAVGELSRDGPSASTIEENETNKRLRLAIIVLLTVVVVQLALVALLVAARLEYVDLPSAWGGLAKPIETWDNPMSHHTWDVVHAEEGDGAAEGGEEEEDEDEEEEEEDDEEGEDEDEW